MIWAWQYFDKGSLEWIQFDCMECLVIEYAYKAYTISKSSQFKQTDIVQGTVDFENY